MEYIKPEIFSLKNHPEFNEKWLQKKIEEDPSILGLGELDYKGSELRQPGGGRLDLMLYDSEVQKRYEVEIQLGKTDESHIIRTIEYWDLERKKNPRYEHCAVIIAEDITSRFLNVISLFNGFVPLIAIQVKAVKLLDTVSLFFTKVLDENKFDLLEEDMNQQPVDKDYWIKKASKETVREAEEILKDLFNICSNYKLKFNKHYIGLEKDGISNNFLQFTPKKTFLILHFKLAKTDYLDEMIEGSDLEVLPYDNQWRYYKIRLKVGEYKANLPLIEKLTKMAFDEYFDS